MANVRKLSAFRQLSLTCESPTLEQRRKSLKKQFSEDLPEVTEKLIHSNIGIKISFSTKNRKSTLDQPPPIKIAWAETKDEPLEITKCKEIKRPFPKLTRHCSLEKDSKSDFFENAAPKETEKPNINIFLAHNSKEFRDEEDKFNSGVIQVKIEKTNGEPKIIPPLFNAALQENQSKIKNVFQIRKRVRNKINLNEVAYVPTRTNEPNFTDRTKSVVVVPIAENGRKEETPPGKAQTYTTKEETKNNNNTAVPDFEKSNNFAPVTQESNELLKPVSNVIIRPSTAAAKRERFQKRTSSAFNSVIIKEQPSRPPLIRSSSAPSKSDQKPKFLATKRKIKSKKDKSHKSSVLSLDCNNGNGNNKENPKGATQKVLNRSILINGVDVESETMVSLVSPAESDNEEFAQQEKDNAQSKSRNNSPNKCSQSNRPDEKNVQRNSSLRKIAKSVSFQQSSIHAIRSFSASFPARRGSMGTALLLGNNNNNNKFVGHASKKIQEKRNSISTDDEIVVPKRRLVRSNTEDCRTSSRNGSFEENSNNTPTKSITIDLKAKDTLTTDKELKESSKSAENITATEEQPTAENVKEDDENPKFQSQKEKQCWDMYCKMSERGITVSFDTILRGMLTPTEYRMRTKPAVPQPGELEGETTTNDKDVPLIHIIKNDK